MLATAAEIFHVLRWFLLQLLLLTFMAKIADILLFIYTARINHGTVTNTHTRARVHQNQHPNVIKDFRFRFDPPQRQQEFT